MKWDSSPVLAAGFIAGFAALPQQALALNMGNLVYEPVDYGWPGCDEPTYKYH